MMIALRRLLTAAIEQLPRMNFLGSRIPVVALLLVAQLALSVHWAQHQIVSSSHPQWTASDQSDADLDAANCPICQLAASTPMLPDAGAALVPAILVIARDTAEATDTVIGDAPHAFRSRAPPVSINH